jgi:dihydrodipicolinate synthase/N-acetylneuraminate lyase
MRGRRRPAPSPALSDQEQGLIVQVEAVCNSTGLGVIGYNRDNEILGEGAIEVLCEHCSNLVGFKVGLDAVGRPAGSVRPPYADLPPDERAELSALIAAAAKQAKRAAPANA